MVLCCGRFWRACASDRAACRNEDLDRRRCYRHAPWLSGPECAGADCARTATILRPCVCVSRAARRHDQDFMVRWRWLVSVREALGTWALHLAASHRRHGLADAGPALDAHGMHRLAQTAEDLDAADRSVSYARDSTVFMGFCGYSAIALMAYCGHGCHRSSRPRSARYRSLEVL